MRLVIRGALVTGDHEAYRHLMEVMMSRDVEIVMNECELLTVPADEEPAATQEPEF